MTQSHQITISQKVLIFFIITLSQIVQRMVYNYCTAICTREQTKIYVLFDISKYLFCHFSAVHCKIQHQTHTNTHITALVPLQNGWRRGYTGSHSAHIKEGTTHCQKIQIVNFVVCESQGFHPWIYFIKN